MRVALASKKTTERRLNWYRYVIRRDEEAILWIVMRTDIQGKRKRGRNKTSWKDAYHSAYHRPGETAFWSPFSKKRVTFKSVRITEASNYSHTPSKYGRRWLTEG